MRELITTDGTRPAYRDTGGEGVPLATLHGHRIARRSRDMAFNAVVADFLVPQSSGSEAS